MENHPNEYKKYLKMAIQSTLVQYKDQLHLLADQHHDNQDVLEHISEEVVRKAKHMEEITNEVIRQFSIR
ncbi:hypothetical protein [Marinicrinis sediminis]|uniref:Uncharacterized protein n=1 Tax=Marinicrinis sediminis TaxID=1652465 RepID=A0ABW5R962_9BACL